MVNRLTTAPGGQDEANTVDTSELPPMPPEHEPLTFTGRLRSFRWAIVGIGKMLRTQHNAWLHAAATLLVIGAGLFFGVSRIEWCLLVIACVSVWTAEALNTALEYLTDVASPEFHPLAGHAKDVAAGAVLIAACGALLIGVLIFGPYLLSLW